LKLSLKTLGILTVIAFIFFPIISPIPGILLLVSMVFIYLSQIKTPDSGLDIPLIRDLGNKEIIQEEKENETTINDEGDKYIIYEKKTLYKENISYEDARKYNLKNTNCIDICGAYEAPTTKNHYDEGHKHCIMCSKWLIGDSINCPCCSSKLRTQEKFKEDEETLL